MIEPVIIGTATLYRADCRDAMALMADSSIDSIVTDPPYELGFMGKGWDKSGIANNVELWKEALRVLKPGGHLLAFGGSRTYHRMTCAIEDAGFEIRDQIMWIYGSGFPKSKNLDGDHKGWGTALKPAHEPICVARKPLVETVAENVVQFGTGAMNIDECRVKSEPMPPNTGKGALPRRKTEEIREAYIPSQPHQLGRWPANIIHDGSDEVVNLFPAEAGAFAPVKGTEPSGQTKAIYGQINRCQENAFHGDAGSAARFFYCAKASKEDRDEGLFGFELKEAGIKNDIGRGFSETDPMRKIMRSNIHPTVKPTDLMSYLVRLVTPKNGTVLDPFMGSGSTGKACWIEGFNFIGIEQEAEYFEIAKARVRSVSVQEAMFA